MDDLKLLKNLKNKILSLAMQGKLVKQDENDEPASILLEKIKKEKSELLKQGKLKKEKELPPISADEVPYKLPKSWKWVRLGEVVSKLGDGIHGTPLYNDNGEYFFINGNNINNKIHITNATKRISFEEYIKYKRDLNNRSILISINGTIGNVSFYNNEPVILGKSICYCNLLDNISMNYILYIMKSKYFIIYAENNATGSTIKNVSLKSMKEFLFPLPPLAEQERIVAKIEEIFAIIDEIEKNITENKKLSKVLYNKLLSLAMHGKLVKQNENDEPASILLEKIKKEKAELLKQGKIKKEKELPPIKADEMPYELPKLWQWVRLGEVCELINGDRSNKYPSDKDIKQVGIPFISAKYIVNNMICLDMIQSFITAEKFQILNNGKLQHRDLVFVLRGSVGKHGIFYISNKYNTGFINAQLIILRPICVNEKYINLLFDTKYFTELLEDKSTGSTVKQMSDNVLSKILIPLPPLAEQERIVAKIEEIKEIIDEIG